MTQFIVFEGPDGVGKGKLMDYIGSLLVREKTVDIEKVVDSSADFLKTNETISRDETIFKIIQNRRALNVTIEKLLYNKMNVLCDRSLFSTIVYQDAELTDSLISTLRLPDFVVNISSTVDFIKTNISRRNDFIKKHNLKTDLFDTEDEIIIENRLLKYSNVVENFNKHYSTNIINLDYFNSICDDTPSIVLYRKKMSDLVNTIMSHKQVVKL